MTNENILIIFEDKNIQKLLSSARALGGCSDVSKIAKASLMSERAALGLIEVCKLNNLIDDDGNLRENTTKVIAALINEKIKPLKR